MTEKIFPVLEISREELLPLLTSLVTEQTIIVTDAYNYAIVSHITTTVLANSCESELVKQTLAQHQFARVLAVGGCTALDIGRACAIGKELFVFPTILSTTCISNDRSRLLKNNTSELVQTSAPLKTIISLPTLLASPTDVITRWTQSGFGDLFANISASIDMQLARGDLRIESIRQNVPDAFDALEWVVSSFGSYDEHCIRKLAQYLHNASLDVICRGNVELSAGSEHNLYHKMFLQSLSDAIQLPATHGQIVGIGSLLAAKILEVRYGVRQLFELMSNAYAKLGIPITFEGLQSIGISRQFLKKSLCKIEDKGLLGIYFAEGNFDILDEVFVTHCYEQAQTHSFGL